MASNLHSTGNCADNSRKLFTREDANRIMAQVLGREMRAQRQTSEKLDKVTGVSERRVEMLRSFAEETPVYLEDILALATVLGPRFVTGLLSEVDMYAVEFNGASPERIADQIIELADKLKGNGK
jgi:hypothetical protein